MNTSEFISEIEKTLDEKKSGRHKNFKHKR